MRAHLLVALVTACAAHSCGQPDRLRPEHAHGPLVGLDVPNPRFSWIIPDQGLLHIIPSSYQLQVLDTSNATVWDSGRVTANNALRCVYSGPAFAADTTLTWRVRYWLTDGCSTGNLWSAGCISHYSHTPPSAADWLTASWIDGSSGDRSHCLLLLGCERLSSMHPLLAPITYW